jgi:hypothetical protein
LWRRLCKWSWATQLSAFQKWWEWQKSQIFSVTTTLFKHKSITWFLHPPGKYITMCDGDTWYLMKKKHRGDMDRWHIGRAQNMRQERNRQWCHSFNNHPMEVLKIKSGFLLCIIQQSTLDSSWWLMTLFFLVCIVEFDE